MSPTIRLLPAVEQRVENGPVQFGDDWPGLFIRGDLAGYYAMALKDLPKHADPLAQLVIDGLREMLGSCIIGPAAALVRDEAAAAPTP